jgi:hypothetical protein
VFYANVPQLGKRALGYLINRPDHIVLAVETHLRTDKAHAAMKEMQIGGWVPIMAPAVESNDHILGNKGGAMSFHKPWLQTATPAVAEGPSGWELPADDLAWKHYRIKGLHLIIGTIYFEHSTGLAGVHRQRQTPAHPSC